MTKVCTKCGKKKALEEFSRDKRQRYGRRPECKGCEHLRGSLSIKLMRDRVKRFKTYKNMKITITKKDIESLPNNCYFCNKDVETSFAIHRIDILQGYIGGNVTKAHRPCHSSFHANNRERNEKGRFMPRKVGY